jgi:hypothetical protein
MKVIIVGGIAGGIACAARLRRFDEKAEIINPVFYKAVLFTNWVMLFAIAEVFIRIFIHTPDLMITIAELKNHLNNIWLGGTLLVFFSFIPFFAFKELVRALGKEKVDELFLHKKNSSQ